MPSKGLSRILVLLILSGILAQNSADPRSSQPTIEVTRQVYLMGTQATFVHSARDRESGLQETEALIRVAEETEKELSTWLPNSPLSKINLQPVGVPLSLERDVCTLFAQLYDWNRETELTFDPAVGRLEEAWGMRQGGRKPSPEILAVAKTCSGINRLDFSVSDCSVRRTCNVILDSGGFGKGEALDRILRYAKRHDLTGWNVDLGGQVMVSGTRPDGMPWPVPLAHPERRHEIFVTLKLTEGSLATSGGSERDLKTPFGRIGHILDPRSGMPAETKGSVSVWHPSGLVADICSTALYVMGPEHGLPWAEARHLAVCYLLLGKQGIEIRSTLAFASRFGVSSRLQRERPVKRAIGGGSFMPTVH